MLIFAKILTIKTLTIFTYETDIILFMADGNRFAGFQ